MKRLLSLFLALMLLPVMAVAEGAANIGIIGSADGPTELVVSSNVKLPGVLGEEALAAGRRVTTTMKLTELSVVELEGVAETKALTELLDALTLVTTEQGDEAGMTLQLNGRDVLDLGIALSGTDAYISSDLLGSAIVVNADEAESLISRILDMLVRMEAMSQTEASMMSSQIQILKQAFAEAQAAAGESVDWHEELKKLDCTSLEKFAAMVENKAVVLTELTVPRMCDPAALGVQATLTNEDMVEGMLYLCQFVLDNPTLKEYLGEQLGFPTEAELDQQWQTNGEFYKMLGLYESEEAFRAGQQTIDSFMAALMEEIRVSKVIDGDYVISVYVNEEGLPVYMTATLPVFIAEETLVEAADAAQQTGKTLPISMTYTRQTVAAGVAHVCNIDVDGEMLTVDMLLREDGLTLSMGGQSKEGEAARLLDVTVDTRESENVEGIKLVTVQGNLYDGEDHVILQMLLDGECAFTDVRSYLSGKLTMTAYEYVSEVEPVAVAEDGTAVDETTDVTPSEPAEPVATTIVLEVSTDTAINGVDFSGVSSIAVEVEGIRVGLQSMFTTADPEESIMAGEVIRPAELDESAFTKWFIGALKSLNLWQANAIDALPESVMEIILFSAEE